VRGGGRGGEGDRGWRVLGRRSLGEVGLSCIFGVRIVGGAVGKGGRER
jgi:hypothetical protein